MDTHNTLPTQAEMWQAVTSNDTAYDDQFVYAVKSTGIYCRPSCKSRDPKPENVAYYATPSDAREAGFRACKRCQPDNATTDQQERVRQMCEYIAANLDGDLSLDALRRPSASAHITCNERSRQPSDSAPSSMPTRCAWSASRTICVRATA
jgi:methylphosphotriester-DNA--protein-cysteine methyltransferase